MSLINDALKRARQAQEKIPPSSESGPQLRPVEAIHQAKRSSGLVLAILIFAGIAAGFFLVWVYKKGIRSPQTALVEQTPSPAKAGLSPAAAAPTTSEKPIARVSSDAVSKTAVPDVTPVPPETIPVPASQPAAPVAIEKPTTPPQAQLKLDGILFDPAHPAAMIGGKMLFINDKFGDWEVVAINKQSATLSNAGQTKVLSLPQ
jgi:hypothetical protein